MKSETIERHRKLKTEKRELKKELSRDQNKWHAIWALIPRLRKADKGEHVSGAVLTGIFKPLPGEEQILSFVPDEELTPSEKRGLKQLDELRPKIRTKERRLKEVQEETRDIELQAIAEDFPLSTSDQGPRKRREPGRPKSEVVKRRRKIVLEVTQATNSQELGTALKDPTTKARLFRRFDEEGIPLPKSRKGYVAGRWCELKDAEETRAKDAIRTAMRRYWKPEIPRT